jgi:pyruvate dehydrogenase E1 component beta subunit
MLSAVYENNPVIFVEHKLLYNLESEIGFDEAGAVPLGKARVVRIGSDVTITAYSYGVHLSLEAAEELSKEGIEAEVIDLISIKPIDAQTIHASVEKTGRLVTVEEGSITGGVGAEVVSLVAENSLHFLDGRIARVGKADVPIPASPSAERLVLPSAGNIVEAVKKTLSWR